MAADLWQLVNGWELVDWSLNVGGDGEPASPAAGGGNRQTTIRRLPEATLRRRGDDEALTLILALI